MPAAQFSWIKSILSEGDHDVTHIQNNMSRQKFFSLVLSQVTAGASCTIVRVNLNNIQALQFSPNMWRELIAQQNWEYNYLAQY